MPPAAAIAPPDGTWAREAELLATRVTRRARRAWALRRLGVTLLAAAVVALGWRAFGPQGGAASGTAALAGILGAGLLVGAALASRAATRVPGVRAADAAWALDRLGHAAGRGLAAAAAEGPAASEAAFAQPPLGPPPAVRLLPPGGLVLNVAAVLVAAVAFLAPPRASEGAGAPGMDETAAPATAIGGAAATDGSSAAARAEALARALDAASASARRTRAALNLPSAGPLDPKEVAAALSDPDRRRKAAAAAESGTALSEALEGEVISGEAVARLLNRGEDNRGEASQHRRDAAGARARQSRLAVPLARRDVVKHYLQLIE